MSHESSARTFGGRAYSRAGKAYVDVEGFVDGDGLGSVRIEIAMPSVGTLAVVTLNPGHVEQLEAALGRAKAAWR